VAEEFAIRIHGVSKRFGDRPALSDVDLDVIRGSVFALVGPDGAGKSTLLKTLCGLVKPDTGETEVLGHRLPGDRRRLRRRLGYLSQRFSLYGDLSIDENLAFTAEIYGQRNYESRRDDLLAMTGLTPFRNRTADKLSGGMRQKLALACTLIHDPDLILLDEPTNGVDPVSRREFWRLLKDLGRRGITLVMSTPYLDEAERADGVAMIHRGRPILVGSPSKIRRDWNMGLFEVFCDRNRRAAGLLNRRFPLGDAQAFGDRVHLALPAGSGNLEAVTGFLRGEGIAVRRSGAVRPGLEDIFLTRIREMTAHG